MIGLIINAKLIGYCYLTDLRLTTEFAKQFVVVELVSLVFNHTRHVAARPSLCLSVCLSVCLSQSLMY